jgi:hypothetical protein
MAGLGKAGAKTGVNACDAEAVQRVCAGVEGLNIVLVVVVDEWVGA